MGFGLFRSRSAIALAVVGCGTAGLQAAVVTFDSGHTFSDSSTLITSTGGYAVHFGPTNYTTTTSSASTPVAFEGFATTSGYVASGASGPATVTTPSGNVSLTNLAGSTSTPTANNIGQSTSFLSGTTTPKKADVTDTGFGNAITSGFFGRKVSGNTVNATFQLALNNLTIGQAYTAQIYLVDARSNGLTASYGNSVDAAGVVQSPTTFQYAYSGTTTVGSYILATFTADAATQNIDLSTSSAAGAIGAGQINAVILQSASTPEPAAMTMLAGIAFATLRRRRKN